MSFYGRLPWWSKAVDLNLGLHKRSDPGYGFKDVPRPSKPEAIDLAMVRAWVLWNFKGRHEARPDVWPRVPQYAKDGLARYLKAHPHGPKPGPKPPDPPDDPPSIWTGHRDIPWYVKRVDISHGLRSQDPVWNTPAVLIARCKQAGVKAICFQVGNDTPDPDWAKHGRELYQACKAEGMVCGGWGRVDYIDADKVRAQLESVMPLDGFMADVEGECMDAQLPEHLVEWFPGLPLAVIATGGIDEAFPGLTPPEVAQRFGSHYDFVSQAYHKETLPLTPATMENFVYWRSTAKVKGGFRHMPSAGNRWQVPTVMPDAEGCPPLEAYRPWLAGWDPFGVWDGELVEGSGEWSVLASL
jgi:hypothetical protein